MPIASSRFCLVVPAWLSGEVTAAAAKKKISRAEFIRDAVKAALINQPKRD
jgi:metal-responsive CopG/Arc/MetJ family transcriptional regulator